MITRLLTKLKFHFHSRFIHAIPKPQKVLTLSNIKLPANAQKKKKRVGRGQKRTAGRGRKGYKMRHSKQRNIKSFEGGQSSLIKKVPKFGIQKKKDLFKLKRHLRPLYLDTLQEWIKMNRIDSSKPIKIQDLVKSGICGKVKDGIVLLFRV
jgi:large subunit ribosomal protein L15